MSGFEFGVVAALAFMVLLRVLLVLVFAAAIIRPVRACPACLRSTLLVRKPWLSFLTSSYEWRWCPTCRWEGLGRRVPQGLPRKQPQVLERMGHSD